MMRLTLAVVAKTLFSSDVESEAAEIGEAMDVVLGLFKMALLPFSELIENLPLPMAIRAGLGDGSTRIPRLSRR